MPYKEYGSDFNDKPVSPLFWAAGIGAVLTGTASLLARRGLPVETKARVAREFAGVVKALGSKSPKPETIATINLLKKSYLEYITKPTWKEVVSGYLGDTFLSDKMSYWARQFKPTNLIEQLTHFREFKGIGSAPKFHWFTKGGEESLVQRSIFEKLVPNISPQRTIFARGKLIDVSTGKLIDTPKLFMYPVGESWQGKAQGFLGRHVEHMTAPLPPPPAARAGVWERAKYYLDLGARGGPGEESIFQWGYWKQRGPIGAFRRPQQELGASQISYNVAGYGLMPEVTGKNFLKSLAAGRNAPQNITTTTAIAHYSLNRLNEALAGSGFSFAALGEKSYGSVADLAKAITFKRALPLFAAGFYLGYANYMTGKLTGDTAYGHAANLFKNINLDIAGIKDVTGFTPIAKRASKVFPWAERLLHPFVEQPVGLSKEELQKYYESGEEPVRKGRFWNFLSTSPFRGGRIQYFQAPFVRRAHRPPREVDYWGSEEEYYRNALLPTPTAPLATIKHLFDPYALERKTYWSHPASITSPLFEQWTPWGALLNATVGRVLKPQRYMHLDEMPFMPGGRPNPKYRQVLQQMNAKTVEDGQDRGEQQKYYGYITPSGQVTPTKATPKPGGPAGPKYAGAGYGGASTVAGQMGGIVGGVATGTSKNQLQAINERIKHVDRYRRRVLGRVTDKFILTPVRPQGEGEKLSADELRDLTTPMAISQQLARGYYLGTELGGIYGYTLSRFTGYPGELTPSMQHIGRLAGFERYFWDILQMGGIGGEASEIARRFFPHRFRMQEEYNPIINRATPSWLPGTGTMEPGYFIDFHTGIPQTKIPAGEYRLPGKIYERVHGIDPLSLKIRGSMLGKSTEEMVNFFLGIRAPTTEEQEEIMAAGTKTHEIIQKRLQAQGVVYGTEVPIYNKQLRASGTVDVLVKEGDEVLPVEIKSVAMKKMPFIDKPYRYHMEQLNFYLKTLGAQRGYLYYVPREDPSQFKVFKVGYDSGLMAKTEAKVEAARDTVRGMLTSGKISRAELYPAIDRFRILADVAPWSQSYKYYRDLLTHQDDLTKEENAEVQRIKAQVTARNKRYEISPYKFKYSNITKQTVTVSKMIDPNTFMVEGSNAKYRLAGVHVAGEGEGRDWLEDRLHPGARISIGYSSDELRQHSKDLLKTIRVTAWSGGVNLNMELIKTGMGKEKEEWGPAGVHARFTPTEIMMGKIGEIIAHAPIPYFHAKFMPEDSAIEVYKRQRVYGQEFQDWSLKTITQGIAGLADRGPIVAPLTLGGIGWVLGKTSFNETVANIAPALPEHEPAWFAKIGRGKGAGAIIGASIGLAAWLGQRLFANKRGAFIPEERRKEREIEEYFDVLKYLKYQGLYRKTLEVSGKTEGSTLGKEVDKLSVEGARRKEKIDRLTQEKRNLISWDKEANAEKIKAINKKLGKLMDYRRVMELTPMDVQALQFKGMAESTLYGAEPLGPFMNVLRALPSREREFFNEFINAAPEERKEIAKYVPDYERRFLEAKWGQEVTPRQDLEEYFKDKYLPPPDWAGWAPETNLQDYKVKVMQHAGLDMREQGIWPREERAVEAAGVKTLPVREGGSNRGAIRARLMDVMKGMGVEDVSIEIYNNPTCTDAACNMNVEIQSDRGGEIRDYAKRHGHDLINGR